MKIMKCEIILLFLIVGGTITESHLLYGTPLPYALNPYYNPYALSYTHLTSPYILPYTYGFEFKHHRPDHKGDGSEIENENNKEPSSEQQPESTQQQGEQMPQTTNKLKYYTFSYPISYTVPTPLSWPTATQFHQQDELGQYHYGYANEHSSKQEIKTLDGITRGSYSYVDSNGKIQTVDYVSDELGFHVTATNLPKAPTARDIPDSPEIAAAKEEHLRAQKEALDRLANANNEHNNDQKQ